MLTSKHAGTPARMRRDGTIAQAKTSSTWSNPFGSFIPSLCMHVSSASLLSISINPPFPYQLPIHTHTLQNYPLSIPSNAHFDFITRRAKGPIENKNVPGVRLYSAHDIDTTCNNNNNTFHINYMHGGPGEWAVVRAMCASNGWKTY